MENISALIQEAKPLYFKRKKRRQLIKKTSVLSLCAFLGCMVYFNMTASGQNVNLDGLYASLYDNEVFEKNFAFDTQSSDWIDVYNMACLF